MNEIANDLRVDRSHFPGMAIQVLISMLGELHAIRLQMNELLTLTHDPSRRGKPEDVDKKVAVHFDAMFETNVSQTKRDLRNSGVV
jgi:hypothetical protein